MQLLCSHWNPGDFCSTEPTGRKSQLLLFQLCFFWQCKSSFFAKSYESLFKAAISSTHLRHDAECAVLIPSCSSCKHDWSMDYAVFGTWPLGAAVNMGTEFVVTWDVVWGASGPASSCADLTAVLRPYLSFLGVLGVPCCVWRALSAQSWELVLGCLVLGWCR